MFSAPVLLWEAARKGFVPLARGPDDADESLADIIVDDILRDGLREAVEDTLRAWLAERVERGPADGQEGG